MENDTLKLLRECDAGIKMGVASIDGVLDKVQNKKLYGILKDGKDEHERIREGLNNFLEYFGDDGKEPNIIAKSMAKMKTDVKMTADESDKTAADLIVDGCNMGVKSLSRYLNQYKAADEASKAIAKKLIACEEQLSVDMRAYL